MNIERRRTCILCGNPLSIERGEVCIGCSLIALYAGDDPMVRAAQWEAWARAVKVAKERRQEQGAKEA